MATDVGTSPEEEMGRETRPFSGPVYLTIEYEKLCDSIRIPLQFKYASEEENQLRDMTCTSKWFKNMYKILRKIVWIREI